MRSVLMPRSPGSPPTASIARVTMVRAPPGGCGRASDRAVARQRTLGIMPALDECVEEFDEAMQQAASPVQRAASADGEDLVETVGRARNHVHADQLAHA